MTDFSRLPPSLRNQFHKIRRRRLKEKQTFFALLGNGSGGIPFTKPDGTVVRGKVWVRFQSSADADGNVTYTPPKDVNAGVNSYFEYDGSPVRVGFDDDGELEVKRSDAKKARDAGLDTRILNTGNPSRKWLYLRNLVNFKSLAPGSSTVVSVRSLIYDDNYGGLNYFAGTRRLADKIDLAAYIPAAGYHRVACLFLRTTDNTIQVYASTTQAIATSIALADYQECFAQREAESIPIQAYILQNAQTSISMLDSAEDLRQIFNMPQALGFPSPVTDNQIIRDGRSVTHAGDLIITGSLTVLGTLTVLGNDTRVTSEGGTFGDHHAGNYSAFEDDGTLRFEGNATVYNDLQFSLSGAKVPASNAPTWETFTTNTKEYGFAVNDYIDTEANEVPHSWELGSQGEVHLHVTTKAANSTGSDRFAQFTIYVAYCNGTAGNTWQETSLTAELTIPDGTSALQMFYLDIGNLTLTGFGLSSEIKLRVKRIAATGGTEYSGNIFLTQAGVHLKDDTMGSRLEAAK